VLVPTVFVVLLHAFGSVATPGVLLLQYLNLPPAVQTGGGIVIYMLIIAAVGVLVWRAWCGLRTQPPAGPRHEFKISPSVRAEFHIDRSQFPELLRTAQRPCEIVPGWGDHRIRVAGVEIAFFVEDTAIQVSFEGEIPEAEARSLAEEFRTNIEQGTGGQTTLSHL
jgi:hypothetical protein